MAGNLLKPRHVMTSTATVQRPPARPAAPPRSLLPHEHGAWGQLAMPLLTALAIGRPGLAPSALAAAVVLAFVAHEPLLVLLGQRGRRVGEEEAPRARRWLAVTGGLAAVTGALGIALAPAAARVALALPAALAVVVALLVWRRLEKTTLGEIGVAAALASAGWAVALAGHAPAEDALAAALAWVIAFAAATLGVRVILARARSKGARDPGKLHAVLAAGLAAVAVALAAAGLPAALAWATLPTALLAIAICLAPVSPKQLKPLGWAIVGSSAVTFVILVAGLR